MIPKVIHYCWFGRGKKPKTVVKCIESWKRICPEYKIVEWNEDNYDVCGIPYSKYCYKNEKWAYLSDYVRLDVIYRYGGVYFDTDVELIRHIDELLDCEAFFGFEDEKTIATGLGFGAVKNSSVIMAMMEPYLIQNEANIVLKKCPNLNTKALSQLGVDPNGNYQEVNGIRVLPVEYMNPYHDSTGVLTVTENTFSIHWYTKSALSKRSIIRSRITRPFHRCFGVDCFQWMKKRKKY